MIDITNQLAINIDIIKKTFNLTPFHWFDNLLIINTEEFQDLLKNIKKKNHFFFEELQFIITQEIVYLSNNNGEIFNNEISYYLSYFSFIRPELLFKQNINNWLGKLIYVSIFNKEKLLEIPKKVRSTLRSIRSKYLREIKELVEKRFAGYQNTSVTYFFSILTIKEIILCINNIYSPIDNEDTIRQLSYFFQEYLVNIPHEYFSDVIKLQNLNYTPNDIIITNSKNQHFLKNEYIKKNLMQMLPIVSLEQYGVKKAIVILEFRSKIRKLSSLLSHTYFTFFSIFYFRYWGNKSIYSLLYYRNLEEITKFLKYLEKKLIIKKFYIFSIKEISFNTQYPINNPILGKKYFEEFPFWQADDNMQSFHIIHDKILIEKKEKKDIIGDMKEYYPIIDILILQNRDIILSQHKDSMQKIETDPIIKRIKRQTNNSFKNWILKQIFRERIYLSDESYKNIESNLQKCHKDINDFTSKNVIQKERYISSRLNNLRKNNTLYYQYLNILETKSIFSKDLDTIALVKNKEFNTKNAFISKLLYWGRYILEDIDKNHKNLHFHYTIYYKNNMFSLLGKNIFADEYISLIYALNGKSPLNNFLKNERIKNIWPLFNSETLDFNFSPAYDMISKSIIEEVENNKNNCINLDLHIQPDINIFFPEPPSLLFSNIHLQKDIYWVQKLAKISLDFKFYPNLSKEMFKLLFLTTPESFLNYEDFREICMQNVVEEYNSAGRVQKSIQKKFMRTSKLIKEKNKILTYPHPSINNMVRYFIVVKECTFSVNPWNLYNTGLFTPLFFYGLRNLFTWGHKINSCTVFEYIMPQSIIENKNSQWNQYLKSLVKDYEFPLYMYFIKREEQNLNLVFHMHENYIGTSLFGHQPSEEEKQLIFSYEYDFSQSLETNTESKESLNYTPIKNHNLKDYPYPFTISELRSQNKENFDPKIISELFKNHHLYNPEPLSEDLHQICEQPYILVVLLDVTYKSKQEQEKIFQEVKNQLIFSPLAKHYFTEGIPPFNSINQEKETYIISISRWKHKVFETAELFMLWCEKNDIPYHITPVFNGYNMDHPDFPLQDYMDMGRRIPFYKFTDKNGKESFIELPLYKKEKECYSLREQIQINEMVKSGWDSIEEILRGGEGDPTNILHKSINTLYSKELEFTINNLLKELM